MSLKWGSQNVTDLKWGSDQVKKIMFGSTVVWNKEDPTKNGIWNVDSSYDMTYDASHDRFFAGTEHNASQLAFYRNNNNWYFLDDNYREAMVDGNGKEKELTITMPNGTIHNLTWRFS